VGLSSCRLRVHSPLVRAMGDC